MALMRVTEVVSIFRSEMELAFVASTGRSQIMAGTRRNDRERKEPPTSGARSASKIRM
jgi:hypothetical protein